MSRSTLRPKTVRPLAVALGVGVALAVLAPSPFVPEAAAQFSFGGSRLGSGQDRPARTPGGMVGRHPMDPPAHPHRADSAAHRAALRRARL